MTGRVAWLLAFGLAVGSCTGKPQVSEDPVCRRTTCEAQDAHCGTLDDGCGGTLECGGCPSGQVCGANGKVGRCGVQLVQLCADEDLGSALPVDTRGVILNAGVDGAPLGSCALAHSDFKRSLQWTAPKTGLFVIDTAGSAMDTILSVRKGDCSGPEVACDTDGIRPGNASRVVVGLQAGEKVLIVIHGPGPRVAFASGAYRLHVREQAGSEAGACGDGADNDGNGLADCADAACADTAECRASACGAVDLGHASPVHFEGTTSNGGNFLVSACGQPGAQERVHVFTAPRTGGYVATVNGATTLYVRRTCGGDDLACRYQGLLDTHAVSVSFQMVQGESVIIAVESVKDVAQGAPVDETGRYALDITDMTSSEVGQCKDHIDNDGDFEQDCEDSDCATDAACQM